MLSLPLKLDAVSFATVAVPATPIATFASVANASIEDGAQFMTEHLAGHPAPSFGAIQKIQPQISFTTPQLDVAMGLLTTWGAGCASKLYQKKSSGVAPLARSGTVHKRHSVAQAVACWTQLTLPALGVATVNMMVRPIFNGTDNPIVYDGAVALPSGVMVATNYFAAGPVSFAGSAIDGIESISIASGANFRGEGDASTVFDTYGEINIGQTMVTIKTKNPVNWSSVLLTGLNGALAFYAKKWANAEATSFVDDAEEEHILFANEICIAAPMSTSADGQNLYSDTLQVLCLAPDDVTPPLTTTLLQAIT